MRGMACAPSTKYGNITCVRHAGNLLDRVDCTQRVGQMPHGHNLRLGTKQLFKFLHHEFAAIIDWRNPQLCAFLFTQHLPRHNVGVVLHGGDQDFISSAHVLASVSLGHKIDCVRGAANKDDLLDVGRVHELLAPARGLFRKLPSRALTACARRDEYWSCPGGNSAQWPQSPPAASVTWRHCPDTPVAFRGPSGAV